jgi:hypothetical protein
MRLLPCDVATVHYQHRCLRKVANDIFQKDRVLTSPHGPE